MEGLRTFLKVVICIILVPIILAFTVIMQTKDIVENQFVLEAVKQICEENIEEGEFDQATLDELMDTRGTDELFETMLSEYRAYAEDNTYEVGDATAEMIINYCLENEEALEKLAEDDIDFEELKTPEAKEEIKNAINEAFKDINEDSDDGYALIIYGYAQATSAENLMKVELVIAGGIILLILLSWSTYKWMTSVGVVGLVTGAVTLGLYAACSALADLIKENVGLAIDVKLLLIIGAVEFVLGLAFVITRSVLDSNAKKAKVENNEIVRTEPDVLVTPEVKDEPVVKDEPEATVTPEETDSKENEEN